MEHPQLASLIGAKVIDAIDHDGWWTLRLDNGLELRAESDSGKIQPFAAAEFNECSK